MLVYGQKYCMSKSKTFLMVKLLTITKPRSLIVDLIANLLQQHIGSEFLGGFVELHWEIYLFLRFFDKYYQWSSLQMKDWWFTDTVEKRDNSHWNCRLLFLQKHFRPFCLIFPSKLWWNCMCGLCAYINLKLSFEKIHISRTKLCGI